MIPQVGRLQRVDLRSVWPREDTSFTPWLAQPENLQLLAESIGLSDLELVGTEHSISEYSVDIIARIHATGELVAIENQIDGSDHKHLGQTIVYAAGSGARYVVWIVEHFTDGHRAALDWLNRVTNDSVDFFGLELEAWRIGESPAAPKMNVVIRPNQWVKRTKINANRAVSTPESELNAAYWNAFVHRSLERGVLLNGKPPRSRNFYHFVGEEKRFAVVAFLSRANREIGTYIGMYFPGAFSIAAEFHRIHGDILHRDLGHGIAVVSKGETSAWFTQFPTLECDVDDKRDWTRQHDWLTSEVIRVGHVFERHLASIEMENLATSSFHLTSSDDAAPSE